MLFRQDTWNLLRSLYCSLHLTFSINRYFSDGTYMMRKGLNPKWKQEFEDVVNAMDWVGFTDEVNITYQYMYNYNVYFTNKKTKKINWLYLF